MNTNLAVGVVRAGNVSVPLSAAVAAFLDEKAGELSPYSIIHLQASLTPLIVALSDPPAAVVAYADLRGYVDALHLRYRPGTIRPVVGDLRQFWRWAKKRGYTAKNPAKRLRMPSRRATQAVAPCRAAPENDVRQVLDYLAGRLGRVIYRDLFGNLCAAPGWSYQERRALRDLFVIVLAYETGARIGEIQSLASRAMDDALAGRGPAYPLVVTGKTGQNTLWFTAATSELWRLWQDVRPRGCEHLAVVGWYDHADPGPIRGRSTLSRMIANRCREAGVTPFRAHALRHAKAKRAAGAVGLEAASRLLDHSSPAVTAQYAVMRGEELSAAAAKTGLGYRLWA